MHQIKELNLDTFKDFVNLIDFISYEHEPTWKSCYCHFYHNQFSMDEWMRRTGTDNKKASYEAVLNGKMKGFIAYDDNKPIGWLNANDRHAFVRLEDVLKDIDENKKAALSICFIVDPKYQGLGVASLLLDHAIKHYENIGYDMMIALPIVNLSERALNYRGMKSMYEKRGYALFKIENQTHMMIKYFKP